MTPMQYTGQAFSFFELLTNNRIEIPIIQRDYAQGRINQGNIRKNFLTALKDSLVESSPIMLDFIYGSKQNEIFLPLDGQQRLTTLFLLHWYAACKEDILNDNTEILSQFSYETRITSRDFCKQLVSNKITLEEGTPPSSNIIDSNWFFLSWKSDPTIDAMLRTIDDVHEYFYDVDDLWSKLTESSLSLIKFYYVELENIGLTDDLYIKMNARGKLLTSYENFKAGFEKRIITKEWEKQISVLERFAYKIDTVWTDLFWKHFKKNESIDDAFIRFFATLAMISISVERTKKTEDRYKLLRRLNDNSHRVLPKNFSSHGYKYVRSCLELLSEKIELISGINSDLPYWRHKPQKNFISEVVYNETAASYSQKVLLFAQLEYFLKHESIDVSSYERWMRVVRNIISRGDLEKTGARTDIVRSPETFDGMINLISELAEGCSNIDDFLLTHGKFRSAFAKDQIEEERIKAQLIKDNPSRASVIYEIEDCDLLRGRIEFALYCIDYEPSTNNFDDDKFSKVKDVLIKYFKKEVEVSNDLRRALLTIESEGKFEFYNYWWSFWNVVRSDKRRLVDRFRELEYLIYSDQRIYLKKLILSLIDNDLENILDSFSPPDGFPNWKLRLIKEKDLLDEQSKSNYIAIPEDQSCCYLLKSKRPRDISGCVRIE